MNNQKIGIIAGEGKFPLLIAKKAKEKGFDVFVICAKDNAVLEDFAAYAAKSTVLKLGQLGAAIKFFKQNEVKKVVMAGRVKHINIFSVMPDLRAAKVLASVKDMRAESILGSTVGEFKKEGIEFAPSSLFLEDFIPHRGVLTKRKPSQEEEENIKLGIKVAKTLADLDVGLTCVVANRAVVALEGMEGTDLCIKRAGEIYASSAAVKAAPLTVIKVARTKQDQRYDLPVIGKGTIKAMIEAKAATLAIEADKTLVLDMEQVIELADDNGIAITAV